ncbi:MAG: dihydropteroate synthase [Chlorobiaceae bacterium]
MNSSMNMPPPYRINCRERVLDFAEGPKIMGILNTTPDSFYDGGAFKDGPKSVDLDRAMEHAMTLIRAGASIIDIGGESTRPGSEKVSADEEILRTVPLITLLSKTTDAIISIDTWKSEVAEKALEAGAHMVNDISGFSFDPRLPEICGRYRAAVTLMQTPVKPETMHWSTSTGPGEEDIVSSVISFLKQSIAVAEKHGVKEIIIDPGFGFGKSVGENFQLLNRLRELQVLGRPVLAGLSRKSFLGHAIARPGEPAPPPRERLVATTAAHTIALMRGASILRVHDVEEASQCVAIVEAMARESGQSEQENS